MRRAVEVSSVMGYGAGGLDLSLSCEHPGVTLLWLHQDSAACFSPFRSREGESDSARRILDLMFRCSIFFPIGSCGSAHLLWDKWFLYTGVILLSQKVLGLLMSSLVKVIVAFILLNWDSKISKCFPFFGNHNTKNVCPEALNACNYWILSDRSASHLKTTAFAGILLVFP